MKEYKVKVVQAALPEDGERLMNQLAQEGWSVASTAAAGNRFIITFERDV